MELILREVAKPARYTGGELHSVSGGWDDARVRMVFAFPDVYEVGMSHLGGKILYGLVNREPGLLMERTFAPWPDMEAKMRERGIPLFSLESRRPVRDFDVIGFSLQYELSYSNVINMLDLAGLKPLAAERGSGDPLVMAGGPGSFNPEPVAGFFDLFVVGDGEEVLPAILEFIAENRGRERREVLLGLAQMTGVYVPSFYEVSYRSDGTILERRALHPSVPERVRRAVVEDLDRAYFPVKPVVPYLGVIHDRASLELMRGCQRSCRFCQAGMIYRPVRERSLSTLKDIAGETVKATGYDEVSLASLSSADYSGISELTRHLVDTYGERGVGVALPSLRVDAFSVGLAREVQKVRKTTLTFAPEAGSQRLRDFINKNVSEDDIMQACAAAFAAGWHAVKLYFMAGLPTETEADLDEIINMAREIRRIGSGHSRRPIRINTSIAFFVPKPHTPLQWERQITREEMRERKEYVIRQGRIKNTTFSFHDPDTSFLEAAIARGDRRLSPVLLQAWEKGAKFDGWSEYFNLETYLRAFDGCGLDPAFFAGRPRALDERLPWEFIDAGVDKEYLLRERERAYRYEATPDCRFEGCQDCGVCPTFGVSLDIKGGAGIADQS